MSELSKIAEEAAENKMEGENIWFVFRISYLVFRI